MPGAADIIDEEDRHEKLLIEMIDEERLRYVGSIVLGLNDALVELTGTLAGLTLALRNVRLIGMAGLITGIAASLSMAASEYLSTSTEEGERDPLKACLYTGVAYVFTVVVLIADEERRKALSAAAVNRAQDFSLDRFADRLKTLLED